MCCVWVHQACWAYADSSVGHAEAGLDAWQHQEAWGNGERERACNSPTHLCKLMFSRNHLKLCYKCRYALTLEQTECEPTCCPRGEGGGAHLCSCCLDWTVEEEPRFMPWVTWAEALGFIFLKVWRCSILYLWFGWLVGLVCSFVLGGKINK